MALINLIQNNEIFYAYFTFFKLRIWQFSRFLRIFLQRKPSPGGCSDRRGKCQEEGAGEEEGPGGGEHETVPLLLVVVDNPPWKTKI